jgi:hypothetical protein
VKRRGDSAGGYALLAALLVIVLAATFALVVVAGVHSLQLVERADAAAWRAGSLEGPALAAACRAWRWQPSLTTGAVEGDDAAAGTSWRASWEPAPPVGASPWPRLSAHVTTASGRARWSGLLTIEVVREPWAAGVTCREDADVDAELVVSGSGVYVGGCVRGRERVRFTAETGAVTAGGLPADGVRGDVFPAAAVHGGVGIFARGLEIHEVPGEEYPDDSDRHTGESLPSTWLAAPTAEFMLAAGLEGTPPGPWFSDGRLRLAEVPPASGAAAGGRCLVLPFADEVIIEGSPSPAAGPLLVVVRGDAVVGQPGEAVELTGGLVVCGHLTVRGDLELTGSLHAGSVSIAARTHVVIPADWRERSLPGTARPIVIER